MEKPVSVAKINIFLLSTLTNPPAPIIKICGLILIFWHFHPSFFLHNSHYCRLNSFFFSAFTIVAPEEAIWTTSPSHMAVSLPHDQSLKNKQSDLGHMCVILCVCWQSCSGAHGHSWMTLEDNRTGAAVSQRSNPQPCLLL